MTTFNNDGADGVAENFGRGLTISLLDAVLIAIVVSMLTSNVGNASVAGQVLLSAGQGLGLGLAEGTGIGVGVQPASEISTDPALADAGASAQALGRGLTDALLANGPISDLGNVLAGNTITKVTAAEIAEGFGISLVDGIQQSIENAGVVGGILDMTPAETMGMLPMPTPSTFDDSVGGAANGIGLGLGFEAA